jgi:hypothetical protein
MKKFILFMSCAIAMCVSLTSCSDNDGDGVSSGNKSRCVYTTSSGDQIVVSAVNSGKFSYDSNGFLVAQSANGGWMIDYSTGAIYDADDDFSWKFSTNSSGYVTKLTAKDDGEEYYTTLSYNSNGYLAAIEQKYSDNGGYSHLRSTNLTWEDGGLTAVKVSLSKTENGKTETENYAYTITSAKYNQLGQYTYGMIDILDIIDYDLPSALWMSGLMGESPEYLPTYYTCTRDSNNGETSISYDFNANNSISHEEWKEVSYDYGTTYYSSYNYFYTDFTSASKAPKRSQR